METKSELVATSDVRPWRAAPYPTAPWSVTKYPPPKLGGNTLCDKNTDM